MSFSTSAKNTSSFAWLGKGVSLLLAAIFVTACTSGDDLVPQRAVPGSVEPQYTPGNAADAFVNTVYNGSNNAGILWPRCGGCHNSRAGTPQTPFFGDFTAADAFGIANNPNFLVDVGTETDLILFDKSAPSNSGVVKKVAAGHNCWSSGVSDPCAVDALALSEQIQAWVDLEAGGGGGGGGGTVIPLEFIDTLDVPGADVAPTPFLTFPADSTSGYSALHTTLKTNCSGCHSDVAPTPQTPFFAVDNIEASYDALKDNQKIDIINASKSRIYLRLTQDSHNCWTVCTTDGATILANINTFIASLGAPAPIPTEWVKSQALKLSEGKVVSGGVRYEPDVLAKYEFKDGETNPSARTTTDNINPRMDLNFQGDVEWVSGWGVRFNGSGFLMSDKTSTGKLYDAITLNDEYSIEAWVIPANVSQGTAAEPAVIASYGFGVADRNFTLGQAIYNYTSATRLRTANAGSTNAAGAPDELIHTVDAEEVLQATLQHVVLTYHHTDGRKIYINGEEVFADTTPPGEVADWQRDFFFTLGAESDNTHKFMGTLRMLAIHKTAMPASGALQNFEAGVGQKYNLMFKVGHLDDAATNTMHDQSYIMMTVEEFDGFSYKFFDPKFVVLNADSGGQAMTGSVNIKGMRIGLNGKLPEVGQVFGRLGYAQADNVNWNMELRADSNSYRSVSNVISTTSVDLDADGADDAVDLPFRAAGTIIAKQNGPDGSPPDQFFLTFEDLNGIANARTPDVAINFDPTYAAGNVYNFALRNFDEVYATLSKITGVDPNTADDADPTTSGTKIKDVFATVREALPAIEDAQTFVSANQVAVAKLTFEFCNALVDDSAKRSAFFNVGGTFNFGGDVATAFGGSGKAVVVDSLLAKVVGSGIANQPSDDVIRDILTDDLGAGQGTYAGLYEKLVTECATAGIASCTDNARTLKVVKSMCIAVLGSAAMLIQ